MNSDRLIGFSLAAAMLVTLVAGCADQDSVDENLSATNGEGAFEQGVAQTVMPPQQDGAHQALEGLLQIRREQCQTGNQLACEDLSRFPERSRQLVQSSHACSSGDEQACTSYGNLAQGIFTAYSESAAVMQQGEEAMAQMNAWRAQMNRNAATSLANLRAQGAAGQAAHEARQQSYEAMNGAWQSRQDGGDTAQQQRIDQIYEQERCSDGRVVSIHIGC